MKMINHIVIDEKEETSNVYRMNSIILFERFTKSTRTPGRTIPVNNKKKKT